MGCYRCRRDTLRLRNGFVRGFALICALGAFAPGIAAQTESPRKWFIDSLVGVRTGSEN